MLVKISDEIKYAKRENINDIKFNVEELFKSVNFMPLREEYEVIKSTTLNIEEFILKFIEYKKEVFASLENENILNYFLSIYDKQDCSNILLPVYELKTTTIQLFVDDGKLKELTASAPLVGIISGTREEIDYCINTFNAIAQDEGIVIALYDVDYCTHCGRFDVDFESGVYIDKHLPYEGNLSEEAELKNIFKKYIKDVEVI